MLHFIVPLMALNGVLFVLGFYLIFRSLTRIHRHDRMIEEIKRQHSCIAEFLD